MRVGDSTYNYLSKNNDFVTMLSSKGQKRTYCLYRVFTKLFKFKFIDSLNIRKGYKEEFDHQ